MTNVLYVNLTSAHWEDADVFFKKGTEGKRSEREESIHRRCVSM